MDRSAVPALTRAMSIVDLLADAGQSGLTVAELATRTGIAKSTTALLCTGLESEGMARRYDGRYRLGRRFLGLAADYLATVDDLEDFYETVRRLPIISREAARLALLEGTDVIYLARYESAGRPRRVTGGIGDRFPASITATGKAMLATLPPDAVQDRFRVNMFPRSTPRSIHEGTTEVQLVRCTDSRRRLRRKPRNGVDRISAHQRPGGGLLCGAGRRRVSAAERRYRTPECGRPQ